MKVKLSEDHFTVGGVYHRAGAIINHEGDLAPFMTEVDDDGAEVPKNEDPGFTVEDLRKKLADYGVKTAPQAGMKRLLEQLAEAEGRTP